MSRKILYIVAAAWVLAFIWQTYAHATEPVKLPKSILGPWCGSWGWQFPDEVDDNVGHLWSTDEIHDCANRGGIEFHPGSYNHIRFEADIPCKINSIKFVRQGDPQKDRIRPKVADPKTGQHVDAPLTKKLPSAVYQIRATCKGLDDTEEWGEFFEIQSSDGWIKLWWLSEG